MLTSADAFVGVFVMWSTISGFAPGPLLSWSAPVIFTAVVWASALLANDRQRAVEEKVAKIRTLITENVEAFRHRFRDMPFVVDPTLSEEAANRQGLKRPDGNEFLTRGTDELKNELTLLASSSFVGIVLFQLVLSFTVFSLLAFVLRDGLVEAEPTFRSALMLGTDTFARGLLLDTFEVFRVPAPVEVSHRWSALNVLVFAGRTFPAIFIFTVAFGIFRASSRVNSLEREAFAAILEISQSEGLWVRKRPQRPTRPAKIER